MNKIKKKGCFLSSMKKKKKANLKTDDCKSSLFKKKNSILYFFFTNIELLHKSFSSNFKLCDIMEN